MSSLKVQCQNSACIMSRLQARTQSCGSERYCINCGYRDCNPRRVFGLKKYHDRQRTALYYVSDFRKMRDAKFEGCSFPALMRGAGTSARTAGSGLET